MKQTRIWLLKEVSKLMLECPSALKSDEVSL